MEKETLFYEFLDEKIIMLFNIKGLYSEPDFIPPLYSGLVSNVCLNEVYKSCLELYEVCY
jgi:hypothetical protein